MRGTCPTRPTIRRCQESQNAFSPRAIATASAESLRRLRQLPRPVRPGCGPGVKLVLEDDRGGFSIDTAAICLALRSGRRPPGPAALHRPESLLGEMAGQSLVAEHDRESDERLDRGYPGTGHLGLVALLARRVQG